MMFMSPPPIGPHTAPPLGFSVGAQVKLMAHLPAETVIEGPRYGCYDGGGRLRWWVKLDGAPHWEECEGLLLVQMSPDVCQGALVMDTGCRGFRLLGSPFLGQYGIWQVEAEPMMGGEKRLLSLNEGYWKKPDPENFSPET